MEKEKLTLQNLHSKLQECCYIAVGDEPVISQGGIKIVQDLLKQIRDEIRGGDSYFMPKKMSDIDNVFNKYLNEK